MGKIAKIIRKYYGAILDTYYYLDGELEKTAYKMPEEEILELIEREIIPGKKKAEIDCYYGFNWAIDKMKENLEKLKGD